MLDSERLFQVASIGVAVAGHGGWAAPAGRVVSLVRSPFTLTSFIIMIIIKAGWTASALGAPFEVCAFLREKGSF